MVTATGDWKLDQIFRRNSRYTFDIPKYQRGYEWGPDQIDDFWADLTNTSKSSDHTHFFGSIFLTKKPDTNQYRIVDGQQRITTVAIFLIVARDYFYSLKDSKPEADKYFERVQEMLYKWDESNEKPDVRKFYLTLSRVNRNFFIDNIVVTKKIGDVSKIKVNGINDTNFKLVNAYSRLSKYLSSEFDNVKDVNSLVFTLLDRFEMIKVGVDDDDEVYEMFNIINNRGTGLNESDLIKNKLFAKLEKEFQSDSDPDAAMERYDAKWADMRTNITGQSAYDLDNFFQHYLIAFENTDNFKLKDLFNQIKILLEGTDEKKPKSPDSIIDELYDWSEIFLQLRNPMGNFERYSIAEHCLTKINKLNAIYVYPVLLTGYRNYWKKNDKQSFVLLTEICLKYHLRAKSIGNINTTKYQLKLYEISCMINSNSSINKIIDSIINSEDAYPSNDKLKPILDALKLSNSLALPILEELERYRDKSKVSGTDVTVEHIMPQNIKHWSEYIAKKQNFWDKTKTEEEISNDVKEFKLKYVNWIGNLALFSNSDNVKSSNKPFDFKKEIYAKEGYKITNLLANESEWTETQILARQKLFQENLLIILDLTKCKN